MVAEKFLLFQFISPFSFFPNKKYRDIFENTFISLKILSPLTMYLCITCKHYRHKLQLYECTGTKIILIVTSCTGATTMSSFGEVCGRDTYT